MVTCGSDDALSLALLACLEPGYHVVVHAPGYQPFTALSEWRGCAVSRWWAREDAGWALDLATLPRLVNVATRMIVVNLPHNPAGYVMPARELGHLLAFAAERDIVVLCDEVYEDLALDEMPPAARAAMLSPHAISISGLSKNFGLPGLRVGWIATQNQAVLRAVTQLHRHGNSYASAPSEFLAALALTNSAALLGRNRSVAIENLRSVRAFMARHSTIITWQEPRAGVVGFPRWSGPETAGQFCANLLAATRVLVAPGLYFDGDDAHLRIGFGPRNVPAILAIVDDYLNEQYGS